MNAKIPGRIVRGSLVQLLLVLATGAGMQAQDRGVGLGILAGQPTGISGKAWTGAANAVDFALSWGFRRTGYVQIHADYLWHFPNVIRSQERFVLYTGVGGRFGAPRDKGILGVRIPFGIAFWPRGVPLDVFFEVAPILDLVPATELTGHAGIGARYFFSQ